MVRTVDDPNAPRHLALLDGMRGIAILLVIATHSALTGYHPSLALGPLKVSIDVFQDGGALGVDLFFFISGFVLFYPYAKAAMGAGAKPTLSHFIDRRFIKIVPSFYLVVFVIAAFFNIHDDVTANRLPALLSHVFFTFGFSKWTMEAFSSSFWSISVETQFYVLFPFIAAAMTRRPFTTYVVLTALANGYRFWLDATSHVGDLFWTFQLPAQLDIFGVGMLSAYAYVRFRDIPQKPQVKTAATVASVVFGLLLFGLLEAFAQACRSPRTGVYWLNDHIFLISWTIAGFTLAGLFSWTWVTRVVALPPLVWFSTISYNLYLWHRTIVSQCAVTGFPCAGSPRPWSTVEHWDRQYFFAYLGVSIAIAAIVTYAFERPLLRMGSRGAYERFVREPYRYLKSALRTQPRRTAQK